jgi:hypothetical protein
MHHSYEKGGLIIDNQPIPWNADAVVVECLARLPGAALRRQQDFQLRIPGRDPVHLDSIHHDAAEKRYRLFFRLPPPGQSSNAEVIWRHHRLGELTLPVVSREEFLQNLRLQHATLAVRLGEHTVACQAFVASQCRGLLASAVLTSPTNLAPLVDLDIHLDWRPEGKAASQSEGEGEQVPLRLSSSQLKSRQALLTVGPARLPRKSGLYSATWKIEGAVLASQRVKVISRTRFVRSLRVSDTRLLIQMTDGQIRVARKMPASGQAARVGPCFLVSSSEVGMAGLCPLAVWAHADDGGCSPAMVEQELLVTDGPTPFVPGTLNVREIEQTTAFELRAGARSLGMLPLSGAPVASFTGEGGFQALPNYSWSTAAEDQLQEKLARLLSPRRNGK